MSSHSPKYLPKNTLYNFQFPPMQKHNLELIQGDDLEFQISDCKKDRNADDDFFDEVVGALQQTVIGTEFEDMHTNFLRKNCQTFEDTEENKVEYMPIFKDYQNQIEKYIENSIKLRMPTANMERFNGLLAARTEEIDEQLLDMLLSFSDFAQFKKLMLEYKAHFEQELAQQKAVATTNKQKQQPAKKKQEEALDSNLFLTVKPLRKK